MTADMASPKALSLAIVGGVNIRVEEVVGVYADIR